jgi:hypothetical protein
VNRTARRGEETAEFIDGPINATGSKAFFAIRPSQSSCANANHALEESDGNRTSD